MKQHEVLSKWLSDWFNPLGEFSPMRGEQGPF